MQQQVQGMQGHSELKAQLNCNPCSCSCTAVQLCNAVECNVNVNVRIIESISWQVDRETLHTGSVSDAPHCNIPVVGSPSPDHQVREVAEAQVRLDGHAGDGVDLRLGDLCGVQLDAAAAAQTLYQLPISLFLWPAPPLKNALRGGRHCSRVTHKEAHRRSRRVRPFVPHQCTAGA